MLDILVITDNANTLQRCLDSIDNSLPITIYILNTFDSKEYPGSSFNEIIDASTNHAFTIINSSDYYLPNVLPALLDFISSQAFGLIYTASLNPYTKRRNPYTDLEINMDTMYSEHIPIRTPVIYNRKIVKYLQNFNMHTYYPERDMCYKIWESFPVCYHSIPTMATKFINQVDQQELLDIIYQAKIRHSKQFFIASPNMYPTDLLEPFSK